MGRRQLQEGKRERQTKCGEGEEKEKATGVESAAVHKSFEEILTGSGAPDCSNEPEETEPDDAPEEDRNDKRSRGRGRDSEDGKGQGACEKREGVLRFLDEVAVRVCQLPAYWTENEGKSNQPWEEGGGCERFLFRHWTTNHRRAPRSICVPLPKMMGPM